MELLPFGNGGFLLLLLVGILSSCCYCGSFFGLIGPFTKAVENRVVVSWVCVNLFFMMGMVQ